MWVAGPGAQQSNHKGALGPARASAQAWPACRKEGDRKGHLSLEDQWGDWKGPVPIHLFIYSVSVCQVQVGAGPCSEEC